MDNKAKILLANGILLEGRSLGHIGTTGGELCFNTGMTGYQEIITDPSYSGQIINMTYPHIGNYGINSEDIESDKIQCSGLIVKQASNFPSNHRSESSINDYLKQNRVVGIQDVDTRMITRIIRDEGAMNGLISSENISKEKMRNYLQSLPSMDGLDLAKKVSCKEAYLFNPNLNKKYRVAAFDFGIKKNILRILDYNDCEVMVFPAKTNKEQILDYNPDGIFLSNGPGDPAACKYAIKTIKLLLGVRPIFGICLGHQILALALGAKTFKLKFGHRGCNHPVKNLKTNMVEITSQNHGFAIDASSIDPNTIDITHLNLNDGTVAGMAMCNRPIFGIQYHPEASPGPHDADHHFARFVELMSERRLNVV